MGAVPCQMEGFLLTDDMIVELLKAVDRKKGVHEEFIKTTDYKEFLEDDPFAVQDALESVKNLYFFTGFTGVVTEIGEITGQTDENQLWEKDYDDDNLFMISLEHGPSFFSAPYSSQVDVIEELKKDLADLMPHLELEPNLTRNWGQLFGTIDC